MTVVTRFAPSPTGYLHIGGARTALFNWLFARHHGGVFRLRIEDTDRARSTADAVDKIFDGLKWLGLDWDGEPVFQFARAARHAEVARRLLDEGTAYRCYCSQEELAAIREEQRAKGLPMRYPGIWRDRDPAEAPAGVPPVIRLKAPQDGETVIADLVQGEVRVSNGQLDDMILLRADGTPTYMLSVVVDDHDMGITHVIRGDDHLTNAFRQFQLYRACGWDVPQFAHIPLIHGPDGAKLSKRHGALGAEAYRDMGYLPEAMRNYLLRLGWSHGDDEIISTEQAVEWFNLDSVGRSPARFDFTKLAALNAHYLRQADDGRLTALVQPLVEARLGHAVDAEGERRLRAAMTGLKERAKTLAELADSALFLVRARPLAMDDRAAKLLEEGAGDLAAFRAVLGSVASWTKDALEDSARRFAEERNLKLGKVAQPVRAALTGASVSPPVFEVMEILGRDESLGRIDDAGGRGSRGLAE
ncbi:MAG: glutamate--tRNA ligase [Magnetospirillum sp.]|nr:glutamate--tRNA ligase [Magnetospirillum sp.]